MFFFFSVDPYFKKQRQFDALRDALQDPCPHVRVIGVEGVCKVTGAYWELIPAATLTTMLTKLVLELSHDATSRYLTYTNHYMMKYRGCFNIRNLLSLNQPKIDSYVYNKD